MKKYLTILILFFSFTASAQIVYTPMSAGGYQMKYLKIDSGFALPFRDTTIGRGINRPGLLVVNTQDSVLYIFNGKKWTPAYVDSTGVIGLIKNKVDSVTLSGNNLFYWSNGTGYGSQLNKLDSIYMSNDSVYTCIAGNCTFRYINSGIDSLAYHYYTQTQIDSINTIYGVTNNSNRIISGGIVTWSGTGLTYYVSACTYVIGGVLYNSPDTTITLTAADPTNPRIDLFAVDTLNRALEITGVAASVPLAPQVDPSSQLALTTGINLPANATTPTGTSSTLIYDENAEWTTGGTATVNFNNTANPYHGTKDALVSSYSKNSTLTFTGTTQTVNGQVLRAFINLLNSNYSFQFRFYNGITAVSNALTLNGFGFNPTLYNTYQNVSIPLSSFTWSGNVFDKLIITMTGKGATGTYYIDYISLESGTPVVTPPTDYSNKVDSVTTVNGSIYYWVKGMSHLVGYASGGTKSGIDSASYHTLTVNSDTTGATLNRPNGTSDFIPLPFVKKTDTTVIKVHYPLWAFTSDSLGLRTDSMPKLEYAAAGRDTSTWDNYTLIDKQFLQDRISTITATGITRTELQDTAAAIRTAIPTDNTQIGNGAGYITSVPAQSWASITGKPTFATVATSGDYNDLTNKPTIPAQFNPIAGTGVTLSGTYPNITFNSSGSGLYAGHGTAFTTYAKGDLIKASGVDSLSRLPIGSDGQRLTVSGGVPVWKDTVPLLNFNFTSIKNEDQIKYDSANNRWVNFTPTVANVSIDSIKITSNSYQDSIWGRKNGVFVLQYVKSKLNAAGQLIDGATITWDASVSLNDSVTLGGNRTLAITNAVSGMVGVLIVKQDATGSRTLTLPANSKVIGGGAGAITLTTAASAKDAISFYFDGAFYYWTIGKNYN